MQESNIQNITEISKMQIQLQYQEALNQIKIRHLKSAISLLERLILSKGDSTAEINLKEKSLSQLAALYIETDMAALPNILKTFESFFNSIPKAKTAKIVRKLLNEMARNPKSENAQLEFCDKSIAWCQREKRNFLRQRLEIRKAELLAKTMEFREALAILKRLSSEAKEVDDKLFLIEVSVLESHVHSLLGNLPLAKSVLIIARTTSTAVYCQQELQARLDAQSGNVALSEKDYKSAFAYFYESFEGFSSQNLKENALKSLKYMILAKMLSGRVEEIKLIAKGRKVKEYQCEELESILDIAEAYKKHSMKHFKTVLIRYKEQLQNDKIVEQNLENVYIELLEKNIVNILKPYSSIQLARLSSVLEMDILQVEKIVSRLILDKKINGVIDQFAGHIDLHEEKESDNLHENALSIINQLDATVSKLEKKAALEALF